jgi:hypothetical protein
MSEGCTGTSAYTDVIGLALEHILTNNAFDVDHACNT